MSTTSFIPKLSQSKSKADFFKQMGWFEHDDGHKRLYQMMMEEAAAGRARTVQNRSNLTPQSQSDPRVGEGPYSSAMITETARHREIIQVYQMASPETRAWYDRAVTNDGVWDNWVIRWCLWHVFRYRDDRNRGSTRGRRSPPGDNYQGGPPATYSSNGGLPYDPIYDQYRDSASRHYY